MDFEAIEDVDGIRLTWNAIPSCASEATEAVVPLGAVYTPLGRPASVAEGDGGAPVAHYEPQVCRNSDCRAILNPYSMLDLNSGVWICRLCLQRNALPPGYVTSPSQLPIELQPGSTTVEYQLSHVNTFPPVFMFVVDTCVDAEDFAALKDALLVSLSLIPPNALVGLVSFGRHAYLHELASNEGGPKSMVFNGAKEYAPKDIKETLGFLVLGNTHTRPTQTALKVASRYILPVQEAEFQLTNLLEQLLHDSFSVPSGERPTRAVGCALNVGLSLLEAAYPNCASRMMLFSAGPCTYGPGMIVAQGLKEPIRSHHDIVEERAPHHKKAKAFYGELAKRASHNGTIVDLFAGCYDQIGLEEMQEMSRATGGALVLTDAFGTAIFKQSYLRLFNADDSGEVGMKFMANLEVKMSNHVKVSGLIGHGRGLGNRNLHVAETEVGLGGTSSWQLCGINDKTSVVIVFDVPSKNKKQQQPQQQQQAVIQFVTHYMLASGQYRLRVTTVCRAVNQAGALGLAPSFDQEAAIAVVSRLAIHKAESGMPIADVIRWVDSTLVKACTKFGNYIRNEPSSFRVPPNMTLFPQFMYHLRRCPLLQVFNNSPDESAYYRHVFNHQGVGDDLVMVQPTLTAYRIDKDPEPVLLDAESIGPDVILLLDTYFHLVIWRGETIAAWKRAGYDQDPEYANFAALLDLPRQDASELLQDRFPLPRFIDTDAGGSQARFLLSRLNPSRSRGFAGTILTDDVSLQDFMEYLSRLATTDK
uniref:Protein transport protein SEC23 n=1 Tax=Blastobotrys adeninivorans TaxID=409370 RepID=A0A060TG94_BLAAD